MVVQVQVVGQKRVALEKITKHIRTRAGRPFNPDTVQEDVRRLSATRLFVHVRPYVKKVEGGRVVIYEVLERPLLDHVWYVGCDKVGKKALAEEIKLKAGDPADPLAVEEGRRKIEAYYQSKGYTRAQVVVKEGSKPEDRGVIYEIDEGTQRQIWWTTFVGNTIVSSARLRTIVHSKHAILWYFRGYVDRKELEEDKHRLLAYYRDLGFFQATVGAELDYDDQLKWATVTFVINEGLRYRIREVRIFGNTKFSTEELGRDLKLKHGEYFNKGALKADVGLMQDRYGAVGYVYAEIKPDPRFIEQPPGVMDIVYQVNEGSRYRVGRVNVNIKGPYPHTQIGTVLNRMSLQPGDIVDTRELRASERRLKASGLFKADPQSGEAPKILFTPPQDDDADKPKDDSNRKSRFRGPFQGPGPSSPLGGPSASLEPRMDATLYAESNYDANPGPWEQSDSGPLVVRGQYTADGSWAMPSSTPWGGARSLPAGPPAGAAAAPAGMAPAGMAPAGMAPAGMAPAEVVPASPVVNGPPMSNFNSVGPGGTAPFSGGAVNSALQPGPFSAGVAPGAGGTVPFASGLPMGANVEASPVFGNPVPEPPMDLPVIPTVTETETGRLMFSVGVNSDAGLIGNITLDEQNFSWWRVPTSWEDLRDGIAWRGDGEHLRLEAMPGTVVQRYSATFQEPYLLNSHVALSLSGYYFERIYPEWDEQRIGGTIGLGYQLTPDLSATVRFRGESVDVYNPIVLGVPQLDAALGHTGLYGFQAGLSYDTRDNQFLATEGGLIRLTGEQVIGSFVYPRAELSISRYFMLYQRPDTSGRQVLSLTARFGVTGDDTPIYETYYAGGQSTIRGFQFRGVSPVDDTHGARVPIGGDFLALASAEYMFPITADDMLRAVVFCDTGVVEPSIGNWSERLRVAPGFGLRIALPAMGPAPIALDFAFPVSYGPNDLQQVFSFSVGFLR
jgi:outer membrane protein insertion porin family